ncbi:MAG TPA: aldolase/citrate lyase family protein [Rhodoblastus sp.]|nr:aldolase/citrate lyase family protein [Rhodoblastus sp.]
MRSILVVPADAPLALAAALKSEADALAIDLGAGDPDAARRAAPDMLAATKTSKKHSLALIHPLGSNLADGDLDALFPAPPDAIILPDAIGTQDIQHLGAKLAAREAENDLPDGSTRILVLVADSPAAIFELGTLARATRRLIGIGRDESRLAAGLGLARDVDGESPEPLRFARSLALLAAAAAGAPAYDCAEPGEGARFERACAQAARDGFWGKFALTPEQARAINAAFRKR